MKKTIQNIEIEVSQGDITNQTWIEAMITGTYNLPNKFCDSLFRAGLW